LRGSKKGLRILDQVEIHLSNGGFNSVFEVDVLEINDDNISVSRSNIDQKMMSRIIGCEISIVLKKSDGSYKFKTSFARFGKVDQIPALKIPIPEKIERIQRRSYSRLSVDIPLSFRGSDLSPEPNLRDFSEGNVVNISAGGLKFNIPADDIWGYRPGAIVDIKLKLKDPKFALENKALILESSTNSKNESSGMLVCRFLDISDEQKEAITVHNIRFQQKSKIARRRQRENQENNLSD